MTNSSDVRTEDILISEIYIDEGFNTRGRIDPASVMDLAKDIERQGLIAPVTVQPFNDATKPDFKYRLLAGFRRSLAHKILKRKTITANIRTQIISEIDALYLNIAENLVRENLSILQEAKAVERLIKMGCNQKEIAERLGKSPGWVTPRIQLLALPEVIQIEVANGVINQRHIRELTVWMQQGGEERAIQAAKEIKQKVASGKKNVSVDAKRLDSKSRFKRTTRDIQMLQDHIFDRMGPNLATVLCGWFLGNNNNEELFDSLEHYAAEIGVGYKRPKYNIWNREESIVGSLLEDDDDA